MSGSLELGLDTFGDVTERFDGTTETQARSEERRVGKECLE